MENSVNDLKRVHDYHATLAMMLKTRFQFYFEEFDAIKELVAFNENMAKQLGLKIDTLEPKPELPKSEEVV